MIFQRRRWLFALQWRAFTANFPTLEMQTHKSRTQKVNGKLRMLLLMKNILNGETDFYSFGFVRRTNETRVQTLYLHRQQPASKPASHQSKIKFWRKKLFASKLHQKNLIFHNAKVHWTGGSRRRHRYRVVVVVVSQPHKKSSEPITTKITSPKIVFHHPSVCTTHSHSVAPYRWAILWHSFSKFNFKIFFIRLLNCL